MGLDQYAYAVSTNGEKQELAQWRKHPNLQGWMANLWEEKGRPGLPEDYQPSMMGDFNCVPLELSYDDLADLEIAIRHNTLPSTGGFFFGDDSDEYYLSQDLEFIEKARDALDNGLTVMYDSWW